MIVQNVRLEPTRRTDWQEALCAVSVSSAWFCLFYLPDWLLAVPLVCVLRTIFGVPCPFCGMTHDFILMVQFETA
ncbi:MAG: DUF2752 domain-containing protein [Acidobacteria bacterium]|nr:DUF2752 domain-containing protein [Acidobacteriota bacterium]